MVGSILSLLHLPKVEFDKLAYVCSPTILSVTRRISLLFDRNSLSMQQKQKLDYEMFEKLLATALKMRNCMRDLQCDVCYHHEKSFLKFIVTTHMK